MGSIIHCSYPRAEPRWCSLGRAWQELHKQQVHWLPLSRSATHLERPSTNCIFSSSPVTLLLWLCLYLITSLFLQTNLLTFPYIQSFPQKSFLQIPLSSPIILPLFFFLTIDLIFLFDCGGSSLLRMGFSTCGVQASRCSGFFCCGVQALGHTGFSSCSPGLSSYSFRALECWLSSCGAQAVAHNMWELPGAGIELVTLALQGGSSSLF